MPSTGLVFKSRMGINVRVETRWSFTGLNNIIYIYNWRRWGGEEEERGNCTGIKRYLVPKVVVGAAAGRRATGTASNKGSTSMLILCKCVEIRCTGIQSVISEKQTLVRTLYTARHSSSCSPKPLCLSLAPPPTLSHHALCLSSHCEMRFSDIRVYIIHPCIYIYIYISVYHPQYPFSGEIILCIYINIYVFVCVYTAPGQKRQKKYIINIYI